MTIPVKKWRVKWKHRTARRNISYIGTIHLHSASATLIDRGRDTLGMHKYLCERCATLFAQRREDSREQQYSDHERVRCAEQHAPQIKSLNLLSVRCSHESFRDRKLQCQFANFFAYPTLTLTIFLIIQGVNHQFRYTRAFLLSKLTGGDGRRSEADT